MILTGTKIESEVASGRIQISPFDKKLVNPNSYNYRLGNELLVMPDLIDTHSQPTTEKILIPEEGYTLQPGIIYLGFTYEKIGSTTYVPSLIGRSSLGRLGLFLQITADLGHLGTYHSWTLEMTVVQPLRVYPLMRIGQVSFWKTDGLELIEGNDYSQSPDAYSQYSTSAPSQVNKFFE
jgi:dCTP deaminase